MQELISLVEDHKWWRNGLRTNTSDDPGHFRVDKKRLEVAQVQIRALEQHRQGRADLEARAKDLPVGNRGVLEPEERHKPAHGGA